MSVWNILTDHIVWPEDLRWATKRVRVTQSELETMEKEKVVLGVQCRLYNENLGFGVHSVGILVRECDWLTFLDEKRRRPLTHSEKTMGIWERFNMNKFQASLRCTEAMMRNLLLASDESRIVTMPSSKRQKITLQGVVVDDDVVCVHVHRMPADVVEETSHEK